MIIILKMIQIKDRSRLVNSRWSNCWGLTSNKYR